YNRLKLVSSRWNSLHQKTAALVNDRRTQIRGPFARFRESRRDSSSRRQQSIIDRYDTTQSRSSIRNTAAHAHHSFVIFNFQAAAQGNNPIALNACDVESLRRQRHAGGPE